MEGSSSSKSEDSIFHGYEYLCIRRFQEDFESYGDTKDMDSIELWNFMKKLLETMKDFHARKGLHGLFWKFRFDKRIASDLWYLAAALDKCPLKLLEFLKCELTKSTCNSGTSLSRYLSHHQFKEIHLDEVFKFYEQSSLPSEIFKCESLEVLSLKSNSLTSLPADIGRLVNLRVLCLTDNCLNNASIPFCLTFCKSLTHLYLDSNLLDALPGFLLCMPQLDTVYRHGNHNYFKATFMWYHTDVHARICLSNARNEVPRDAVDNLVPPRYLQRNTKYQPARLQDLAVQSVIASKENFFEPGLFPGPLVDYIAREYVNYNVCDYCNTADCRTKPGYKVVTFKTPYLGNTCVPFQHWACSRQCAEDIDRPALAEQMNNSQQLETEYSSYVSQVHCEYESHRRKRSNRAMRRKYKRTNCALM